MKTLITMKESLSRQISKENKQYKIISSITNTESTNAPNTSAWPTYAVLIPDNLPQTLPDTSQM